jgi:hypothetical protein
MTLHNLHQYKPIEKFRADPHFIYITAHRDENHEELQLHYNMTDDDMEHTKIERPQEFPVPVTDAKLSTLTP